MSHDETKRGNFPARHTLSKKPVLFQSEQENWQQLRYLMMEYLFRRFTGTYKREKAADTHKKPEDEKPEEETNQKKEKADKENLRKGLNQQP